MVAINISPSGVQIAPNVVQYTNLPVNYNKANSFNANTFAGRSSMSTPASVSVCHHFPESTTVVSTKSDSDIILCLQLLSKK